MAQQYIDFGSFPDDPDADAIRTAFQKANTNFSELYATTTAGSVASVNGGAGITVNAPTGNVIVTANIANVTLNTNTLRMGLTPGNSSLSASITTSSQAITIDIDPANVFSNNFAANSTGGLANFNGTLTALSNSQPNITSVGTLTNLAVTGNITASNVYATTLGGTLNANSNSQPNITTIGTLGNLNVTSNSNLGNLATANYFSGNGSLLTGITVSAGNSILNGNSNVSVSANGNVTTSVAGNANIIIATGTGANITGYLTASGNITGANANLGNAVTANYFIGNLYGSANTATTAGTVTTNAQPNITSVGTLTSLTVTGDITTNTGKIVAGQIGNTDKSSYIYGDGSNLVNISVTAGSSIVNGTSNVSIPSSNGNVNAVVAGNTTLVVTGTGVNVTGTLNATGSITGNFGGNVTNANQASITSLGTLTGLNVNGLSNLGPVGNVTLTGGSANYYLMTNGSGGLSWTNALLTPIPGSNTQVLFNDAGAANAISSLTFNKTTGLLTTTAITGNLTTAAQPNITSLGTLSALTVVGPSILNGNLNTANTSITGILSVTANITTPQLISNVATGTAPFVVTSTTQVANLNVATAGLATYATTANAVAGANVSGTVSSATSAGSATTAGTVTTAAQPNITSTGTLTSLAVSGALTSTNITTGANTTAGTITGNWSLSAGSQLRATYADLAEYYAGDENIEPGTVVEFGGDKEVQICNTYMSRLVAGIVTTNPAYIMNSDIDCEHPIAIALQGRIPARVIGPVTRGDMMVSANNGYAISCNSPAMGTVLGKALTDFNGETGIIEIMVGRT